MTAREVQTLETITAALAEAEAKHITQPADVALVIFLRLKDLAVGRGLKAVR